VDYFRVCLSELCAVVELLDQVPVTCGKNLGVCLTTV
jgi:hypothetical protein